MEFTGTDKNKFLVLYCSSLWLVAENCSKNKIRNFFSFPVSVFSCVSFCFSFFFFFFNCSIFCTKAGPSPCARKKRSLGAQQPRSQSSSAIPDVTSPVKLVGKNSRYRTRFQVSSWIARPGLGTRLDLLSFPLALPPFGCVCNQAYYIW